MVAPQWDGGTEVVVYGMEGGRLWDGRWPSMGREVAVCGIGVVVYGIGSGGGVSDCGTTVRRRHLELKGVKVAIYGTRVVVCGTAAEVAVYGRALWRALTRYP